MGWLKTLINQVFGEPPRLESSAMRHDLPRHSNWEGDIQWGYRFSATIQLRNSFRALSMHGQLHEGPNPPVVTEEMWQGIWVPRVKSFREMGIDLDGSLNLEGTIASDVGQIPRDGGEYLKFLLCVREIVENHTSIDDRIAKLSAELRNPAWSTFCRKLGGKMGIVHRFFPEFVDCIRGLSLDAIHAMKSAKLTTPARIQAAPDSALLAIKGIGPAKIKAIRRACEVAQSMDSERVDTVNRN